MNIETVQALALVFGVIGAVTALCFIFMTWLGSRETHIEPIVSEGGAK